MYSPLGHLVRSAQSSSVSFLGSISSHSFVDPELGFRTPSLSNNRDTNQLEKLPAKMVKGRQGERVRLYVRGTVLGYKRSKVNQYPNISLVQIEGVNTKEDVAWYAGKRVAYIYKAPIKKNGTHYRCIWGKVIRPHGNSGVVRAKFTSNLPPKSMGARIRVFMYPSNI